MLIRRLALLLTTLLSLAAGAPQAAPFPEAPAPSAAIGCTQAALAGALAAGGTITFNCGAGPHSILFDTPIFVTSTATIDGGDQITVSGQNSTTLFLIQSGAALTLTHLTVTNGSNNSGNGGAIWEDAGATLTVDHSTFANNKTGSYWSGGAITNKGALTIRDSIFTHNGAGNSGALDPLPISAASTGRRATLATSARWSGGPTTPSICCLSRWRGDRT